MFRIFLLILNLAPLVLVGQATKKVTINYFLLPACKEIFYALKSDTLIREGPYKLVSNRKIIVQGYYHNNQKDSLWTEYDLKGKLRFQGRYAHDQRSGIWEYYNEQGELEQRLDFTNLEVLLYRTQLASHPFRIIRSRDSIVSVLDRPPLYLGGQSRIDKFINEAITVPFHKQNDKIKGKVFVEFTIDSVGKTSNHHILKGLNVGCNYEALRIVKALPDAWFPGVYEGKNVSVNYVILINFDERIVKTPVDDFFEIDDLY
jgi:Gram-negative bacterial TonB protein C-terminal